MVSTGTMYRLSQEGAVSPIGRDFAELRHCICMENDLLNQALT